MKWAYTAKNNKRRGSEATVGFLTLPAAPRTYGVTLAVKY